MTPLELLLLEEIPGKRLPKADCGDGPSAWLMRRESAERAQRALWAGDFESDPCSPVVPVVEGTA